jgi:uncharacterized protein (DUF1697 family)
MQTHIALLRGINVGGSGKLPMADLRALLTELGAQDVQTYIQSGNAVFRHRAGARTLTPKIRKAIAAAHGFEPTTLLITAEELQSFADANPFPEAVAEPKTLHLFLLEQVPTSPDLELLTELATPDERFELRGRGFYLHAPSGMARSKLAAQAEKHLGTPTTARNWRTVEKLLLMSAKAHGC